MTWNYGDKESFYLRDGPAYSALLGACLKARLTPVNVDFADRIAPLGIEQARVFAEQSIFGITPGGST